MEGGRWELGSLPDSYMKPSNHRLANYGFRRMEVHAKVADQQGPHSSAPESGFIQRTGV